MTEPSESYLLLKWGTLKGWGYIPESNHDLLQKFLDGSSFSCMLDHPDDERKAMLVELIRKHDGKIQNDRDANFYTQDEAVAYVMNYGKKETA